MAQHPALQLSGALHVVDDQRAGIALQHVGREQHQQAVGEDHLAFPGHHAQPVAVAVEGQADVGVEALDRLDQVLEVVRLAGVGVVVGEGAIHFAVQRDDVRADRLQQLRRDVAGHAVAGVHHHLQRPLQLHVVGDALDVVGRHVALLQVAGHIGDVQAVVSDAFVEVGDRIAGQRLAADHDLEPVVVRRVVAAGHRHAAAGTQVVGGEVRDRRGRQADVDDVATGLAQAADQPADQIGTGQAPVAPDHDVGQVLVAHHRADRQADQFGHLDVQRLSDDAADVVGAEDARVDLDRTAVGRAALFLRARLAGGGHRRWFAQQRFAQGGFVGFVHEGSLLSESGQADAAPRHQQRQYGQRRQQAGGHQRGNRAQAQRARFAVRHGGGHAQAGLADRVRHAFGAILQAGVAALAHVERALPQRQVAARGHGHAVESAGQLRQRQAYVHHALRNGRRQAEGRGLAILHHPGRHRLALHARLEQRELAEAEGRRVGIGRLQRAVMDLHLLDARPSLAQRRHSGGAVVAVQCGLHRRRRQALGQLSGLGAVGALHRRGRRVAGALHVVEQGRIAPLPHPAPGQQAGQQQQQHRQQRQRAPRIAHGHPRTLVVRRVHRLVPCHRTPVWPKPPVPRALSAKVSTTCRLTRTTGSTMTWAMRSPGWMVKASCPRFQTLISSGPW